MWPNLWFVATLELACQLEPDLWDTVDWGKTWLTDFLMLEKRKLFLFKGLTIIVALLMWKWMSVILKKNNLLKCWDYLFLLNWIEALKLPLKLPPAIITPRKLEFWFILWSFFPLRLLYKSNILPSIECCCCYVWACAPTYYLNLLQKLQKRICTNVGPTLLPLLAYHQNVASLSLFYIYYYGGCSSEQVQLVPLPHSHVKFPHYSNWLLDFSAVIPRYYKDVYITRLFPCAGTLRMFSFYLWTKSL